MSGDCLITGSILFISRAATTATKWSLRRPFYIKHHISNSEKNTKFAIIRRSKGLSSVFSQKKKFNNKIGQIFENQIRSNSSE